MIHFNYLAPAKLKIVYTIVCVLYIHFKLFFCASEKFYLVYRIYCLNVESICYLYGRVAQVYKLVMQCKMVVSLSTHYFCVCVCASVRACVDVCACVYLFDSMQYLPVNLVNRFFGQITFITGFPSMISIFIHFVLPRNTAIHPSCFFLF